jgi:hypothetical protein
MSTAAFTTLQSSDGTIPTETIRRTTPRAQLNFNQVGVTSIRSSFNVSSITDIGVGTTDINFTNALSDANYIATSAGGSDNVSNNCYAVVGNQAAGIKSTTTSRVALVNAAGSAADTVEPTVAFAQG